MTPHFRIRRAVVFLVLSTVFSLTATIAPAQTISPFGKGQIATDPADIAEINGAIGEVLRRYEVGAVQAWKSAKTDRAGEAVLTQTFQRDGLKCAQVTHRFTAGGGNAYSAPMCQVADGSWKLAF
jgi:surface antigen